MFWGTTGQAVPQSQYSLFHTGTKHSGSSSLWINTESAKYNLKLMYSSMEKIPELPIALKPYDIPKLPEVARQYHVSPNTFVQSALFGMVQRGRRKYLEKKKIVSFRNMAVFFTGGELDQGDLDVFLHAVHLAARLGTHHPEGLVEFTIRGFLKELGKKPGKSGQDWLLGSIRRLSACLVEVHFGDDLRQAVMGRFGCIYGGSLIYDFYHEPARNRFFLRVNADLGSLFNYGWTLLKWKQRLELKLALSKLLQGLYSSTDLYPVKVENLRTLSGSRYGRLSDFRTKLRESLKELNDSGIIESWEIDAEDKVHVVLQQ